MRGVNVRRDANTLQVRDFSCGALFDGNVIAIGNGEIESGDGSGDVERHLVFFGQDGDLVGADLVGGVAVCGYAVGSGDNRADFAGLQKVADHVVRDESERDAAFVKLPGSEARALQIGARFGHEDVQLFALLEGDADDAQRSADAASG